MTAGAVPGPDLRPGAVGVRVDVGAAAVARLVRRVRRSDDDSVLRRLAVGDWVEGDPADLLGADAEPLAAAGVVERDGARVRLNLVLWDAGGLVTALPAVWTADAGDVYLQHDSLWLLEQVWASGRRGGRAVDLGTGSGFLAAALAARFEVVVAADLDPTCTRYAAANLGFNRTAASATGVVRADCGAGLRSGAFDLVTANAPWSMTPPLDPDGRPRVWADGGHRGAELPLRFVDDMERLLAPGGLAVLLCLDTEWTDGDEPIRRRADALRAAGCEVEVRHSQGVLPEERLAALPARVPDLVRARHAALVFERP